MFAHLEHFVTFFQCRSHIYITNDVRHGCDGVSNHRRLNCLHSRVFRRRSKKTSRNSASLAFMRGIHRWPVNSPHKGPVTLKMFPFDGVIMIINTFWCYSRNIPGRLGQYQARYVKLRVAHAPGMLGMFSPPPRVRDPDMHHGTCVTHVSWCMPGSLINGLLRSRWRGKRSRHSRRMRNSDFYLSGSPHQQPLASYQLYTG